MWFKKLTGFKEQNGDQVRANLKVNGTTMTSLVNGKTFECGKLEIASLKDLKTATKPPSFYQDQLKIEELVGNIKHIHADSASKGVVFQAASQFNLLEMVGPDITPEAGIDRYEFDNTQGPACAIACGAGTIYRNYFVAINNQVGQTANTQIDCLEDIGNVLGNTNEVLWRMRNGYVFPNRKGLNFIAEKLKNLNSSEYVALKDQLKVGIQWNTEVTVTNSGNLVTQVYCSALPVAYSSYEPAYWEEFAKLILDATYEATFYAALKNFETTGNNILYLTLVGGGAFGNKQEWIFNAIRKAVTKFSTVPLDVKIVSYGQSNSQVQALVNSLK